MKGYKAFDKNLKCRNIQYKIGGTFEVSGDLIICKNGIHFCEKLNSVYNYYPKNYDTRICEVEAIGEVKTEGDKSVTLKLKILRELNKEQIKQLTDDFKFNSGNFNSGNFNSGNRNSGYWNSGNFNSGYWNSGNRNSGYGNSGDGNSGYFNTTQPKIRLFNIDTELDENADILVKVRHILSLKWKPHLVYVYSESMTEQEKKDHPYHIVTGGFLRRDSEYCYKKSWKNVWDKCSEEEKQIFKSLPNFDAKIFEEITGINVILDDKIEVIVNGEKKLILKSDAQKLGLI